jgi:hypothetical protein
MKVALKWVRVGLEIIGAASLIFLVTLGVSIIQQSREKINKAKPKDVLFILNASEIPTNQNLKVLASYESSRSFTGDHLDYYCIVLPRFEIADRAKNYWHDGPEENPVLAEALEQGANDAHQGNGCFPPPEEANSGNMKIKFGDVDVIDRHPNSADITLYDPKNSKLYYVSYKN